MTLSRSDQQSGAAMTENCPTCGRAIRPKKPKLSEFERIRVRIRQQQSTNLRKPMPKATAYKQ
jgi:hypothetical protein